MQDQFSQLYIERTLLVESDPMPTSLEREDFELTCEKWGRCNIIIIFLRMIRLRRVHPVHPRCILRLQTMGEKKRRREIFRRLGVVSFCRMEGLMSHSAPTIRTRIKSIEPSRC